jgi:putative restriction endonuclease
MLAVRGFVGITDSNWYHLLADRPEIFREEVNFWRPGGGGFAALKPGEPFFFKTHAPHNRVVGGGFFSGSAPMPMSEAWDMLGPGNGVASLAEMRARVEHYRRERLPSGDDPVIGCIFIRDVTFFAHDMAFEPPPDFPRVIQNGKGYDMADPRYERYFGDLMQLVLGVAIEIDFSQPWHANGPVFGDPRLAPYRLGQQAFKAVVLHAYHEHCAITGSKIRPALQAAHIRPVSREGEHRLDNGLLLRSDMHTLFDRGYLAVDPSYKLHVSPRLRSEFGNGETFYAKAGQVIELPDRRVDRPGRDYLQWHMGTVFKAS